MRYLQYSFVMMSNTDCSIEVMCYAERPIKRISQYPQFTPPRTTRVVIYCQLTVPISDFKHQFLRS